MNIDWINLKWIFNSLSVSHKDVYFIQGVKIESD